MREEIACGRKLKSKERSRSKGLVAPIGLCEHQEKSAELGGGGPIGGWP